MKRRDLLAAMPLSLLATLPAGCGSIADTPEPPRTGARQLESFGLQLSTITRLLMADFEGTLAAVAALGNRQVEFSALGFLGRPASLVVDLLKANDLAAPVGRISPKLPADFATFSPPQ